MIGITLDTGALISLERRRLAMRRVINAAHADGVSITVPTVVIAEWWRRGVREQDREAILRLLRVEPLDARVARLAGIAVGLTPGSGTIDAIVMASAAQRGDVVYTSDPKDLIALRDRVPELEGVEVLAA